MCAAVARNLALPYIQAAARLSAAADGCLPAALERAYRTHSHPASSSPAGEAPAQQRRTCRRNVIPPVFLVTGASGQIGTEIVPFLRSMVGPQNVLASDVRDSDSPALAGGPFVRCDVTDHASLAKLVTETRATHIVHLATLLSAVGEKNPGLALHVNTVGIQNVLDIAARQRISVFAPSTIAVFGPSTPKHQTPDATVCEPSTMYGLTKVHQELLGAYYCEKFGVDFRSLRYPGIISAKSLPGGGTTDYAIDMYLAAAQGRDYECFLEPHTPLPMMYMPDCLRATWELIAAPRANLTRCTYNVASMTFTPQQVELVIRQSFPSFKVRYAPDFRQAIARTWPESVDDSIARADWKWRPEFDLSSMTEDMLRELQEQRLKQRLQPAAAVEGTAKRAVALAE